MRTRILLAATALSLSAAAYACSGVDPNSSLLGVGPDAGDDDDASSNHRDAGIHDSGIHDGASNDGDVVSSDGGHDGGFVHPFGDGSVVPTICGTQTDAAVVICNSAAPTCCADQGALETDYSCTAGIAACTGANTIAAQCRDDRDCNGGQVCCGDLAGANYLSLKCTDLSACPVVDDAGAATDFVRWCTPDASDPCPSLAQACSESGLFPGFYRCY